jgi:hypothetical protein
VTLACARRHAAATVCLAMLMNACQPSTPATTSPGGSGAGIGAATPSPAAPETFGPSPSPTPPDETTPVVLDSTLLAYLPATVADIPVTESVDEATQALNNPVLSTIATAMDLGVAVDMSSGNLVSAWVVRVRTDKFTDAIYRQWRDSYDEGACADAGGVVGRADATIDDRTVYITSCAAGPRAYHVWLDQAGILISASAIG